jgi:hypothetical protein
MAGARASTACIACPRAHPRREHAHRCTHHDRPGTDAGHDARHPSTAEHWAHHGFPAGGGLCRASHLPRHTRRKILQPHGHRARWLVCHLAGLGPGLRRAHPHASRPGLHHLAAEPEHRQSHSLTGAARARLVGPDGTLYAHATTTCLVFDLPAQSKP